MHRPTGVIAIVIGSAAVLILGGARAAQAPAAERVLINGKIITVDAKDSIAQAVAIAAGKMVAVGSSDEI